MDHRPVDPPLRSWPRLFLPGADPEAKELSLPPEEFEKLHRVLRLSSGDPIAVLPGDGSLLRCRLDGRRARVEGLEYPPTEPPRAVTLALGIPKPDKLEAAVRMGTELGAAAFVLFPAERTVVAWDERKRADRLRRLEAIAREAAEVAFRTRLPSMTHLGSLAEVLERFPEALVLSEREDVERPFSPGPGPCTLVVGPEGGWAPREVALIGDRAVTLGPRVLRVDTAACAALALALLG